MTYVINLIGGSGIGKSTLAAEVFVEMKKLGLDAELVREYVKNWAYQGVTVGKFDQVYLFGKQSRYESQLYNKVGVIITDSPLLLGPIYELYYGNESLTETLMLQYYQRCRENDIIHKNYVLIRNKPFVTKGRYETEEQAREVDALIFKKLEDWALDYTIIDTKYEAQSIIGNLLYKP